MGVVSQKSVYKKGEGPIFRITFNLKNSSYEQYEPFLFQGTTYANYS